MKKKGDRKQKNAYETSIEKELQDYVNDKTDFKQEENQVKETFSDYLKNNFNVTYTVTEPKETVVKTEIKENKFKRFFNRLLNVL